MTLGDALERIINDGLAEVRTVYREGSDERDGAIEGFELCRGRSAPELAGILYTERNATHSAHGSDSYWRQRYRELQVEWVCNVVSAILANEGEKVIVPPTARGAMKAALVVGVR